MIGSYGKFIFNISRNFQTVFLSVCTISHPDRSFQDHSSQASFPSTSSFHRKVLGSIAPPCPEVQATSAPALSLHSPIMDGSHQPLAFRLLLVPAKPQEAWKYLAQEFFHPSLLCLWDEE